jgi:hypothetical protein
VHRARHRRQTRPNTADGPNPPGNYIVRSQSCRKRYQCWLARRIWAAQCAQTYRHIDGMKLANTVLDLVLSIASIFWQSRGWCFRENVSSLQMLIFTLDQTFYHCKHSQCTEDTHCFDHSRLLPSRDHSSLDLDMDNICNWRVFEYMVAEYISC